MSGVPTGASLNHGIDNGGGSWTLTPAQLSGLTITPPTNTHDCSSHHLTAAPTEAGPSALGLGTASTAHDILVTVNAVADAPTLTVARSEERRVGKEGSSRSSALPDTDG